MGITATKIRDLAGCSGVASLYRISEPIEYGYDDSASKTEFVVVSAVIAPFSGPETFIFPATEDGEAINYLELDGSMRGTLSHEDAIANAGWSLA